MSQANVEIVHEARFVLPPVAGRARQRRSLDQRLFVRVPALYRLLADMVMRLPPQSRLRRLMLTRTVTLAYAAANRRDFDSVLLGWDPGANIDPVVT